jgi:hypothetical protein
MTLGIVGYSQGSDQPRPYDLTSENPKHTKMRGVALVKMQLYENANPRDDR